MDSQVKLHITRMPHKKYAHGTITIYLNDNWVGSLNSAESVVVDTDQGLIKLKAVFSGKSYTKPFLIKESGDHYYNIEIREPKWHIYFKYGLSAIGLALIIAGLVIDPGEKPDYTLFIFVLMIFLALVNKFEQPVWEEVSLK